MSLKLGDLNGVQAWSAGGPPPPGTYLAKIETADVGTSSGGFPQVTLAWSVIGGEYEGAEIRDWLVISEGAKGKIVALLNATDVDTANADSSLEVQDFLASALPGKRAIIVCRSEPGRSDPTKTFTKVAGYKAPADDATPSNGNTSGSHEAPLPF